MPNQAPLVIGDEPYPQYSVTDREFIKLGLTISQGHIYTLDAAGRMIVPVSASGVADLTLGAIQAKADVTVAPIAEDTDEVQVLAGRSRILLLAPAGLVPKQKVDLASSGSTTDADKCKAAASPEGDGFLGRIFEIYTKGTDGVKKQVTANDDLVVIDLEA